MRPKIRPLLEMCINEGVLRGYRRAHKHVENPTEESICEHIEEQIMSSLYDYFNFPNDDEDDYQ